MSGLEILFERAQRPLPESLIHWDDRVAEWCDEYASFSPSAEILEINLDFAVYLFDYSAERVTLAYALSVEQLHRRDTGRMRGFPNASESVQAAINEAPFLADKGHFLGHASGGTLDINLFPQRRELNRGWSAEGKRFRSMERYVSTHLGTFFYHRPQYNDDTWIPNRLEYGVLVDDKEWWVDLFLNK